MARITVEDCLDNIDNQFDLVLTAAKRARQLANGADALVEIENDKPTVIALREIAAGLINDEILATMTQPVDDILSSEDAEELLASTPLPSLDAQHESLRSARPTSESMPAWVATPAALPTKTPDEPAPAAEAAPLPEPTTAAPEAEQAAPEAEQAAPSEEPASPDANALLDSEIAKAFGTDTGSENNS